MMDIKTKFGRAVKQRRQTAQISQEELAMRLGVDQAYVSRIEAGQMNVTLETIDEIAKVLDVEVGVLFE